jgi:uncharacterized protein YjeT (DUF2065 family)
MDIHFLILGSVLVELVELLEGLLLFSIESGWRRLEVGWLG